MDYRGQVIDVEQEKEGPEDSTLGDPREDFPLLRADSVDNYRLLSPSQKGFHPFMDIPCNTIILHLPQKATVGYRIKRLTEIQDRHIYLLSFVP